MLSNAVDIPKVNSVSGFTIQTRTQSPKPRVTVINVSSEVKKEKDKREEEKKERTKERKGGRKKRRRKKVRKKKGGKKKTSRTAVISLRPSKRDQPPPLKFLFDFDPVFGNLRIMFRPSQFRRPRARPAAIGSLRIDLGRVIQPGNRKRKSRKPGVLRTSRNGAN